MIRHLPLLLCALLSSPIFAQSNMTQLGHWPEGPSAALAHAGDIVYISHGGFLEFMDVSDPSIPTLMTRYDVGEFIVNIVIDEGLAFIYAQDRGIHILDVTDPFNVQLLSFISAPGNVPDIVVQGTMLYYGETGSIHEFYAVDISNPASPFEMGFLEVPNNSVFNLDGDYAYIAVGSGSVQIIDVSDPENLVVAGSIAPIPGAYFSRLNCVSGLLYALVHDIYGFRSLRIYDLTDHVHPLELGRTTEGNRMYDVVVDGTRLFATADDSVVVYDIADPTHITVVGKARTADRSLSIALSGDVIFAAEADFGLQCFSVAALGIRADPVEIGRYTEGLHGAFTDVVLQGDYLYATATAPGLVIYEADQIETPSIVGMLYEHDPSQEDTRCYSVTIAESYAYIRCSDKYGQWLKVIDISDPSIPVEVSAVSGRLMDIQFNGKTGYAYQSGDGYFIHAYDFNDPSDPSLVATLELPASGDHFVDNNNLLVTIDDDLWIYNISDPNFIIEIGHTDLAWGSNMGSYLRMHCENDRATIISDSGFNDPANMRVVDYSIPSNMVVHNANGPTGFTYDITTDEGYLYLAIGGNGVETYSLADPMAPILAGSIPTGYYAFGITGNGRKLYVADSHDGIFILGNDHVTTDINELQPVGQLSLRNHPNPFNPYTTITFNLASPERVSLNILDMRGRIVRHLERRMFEAGDHDVAWDGRGDDGSIAPSGVYFSSLRTSEVVAKGEMVLMK